MAATAEEFLQEAVKPRYCPRHTLLPLSRWGWTMPYNVRVLLCEDWGYALEFGGYATSNVVNNLDNPESDQARLCALTASDPDRYPLFVLLHRPFTSAAFRSGLPDATWCHDADGNLIDDVPEWKRYSPEMPVSNYELAGDQSIQPLVRILEECPISVILNGGEYGLSVYGHSGSVWERDPAVVAAKGARSWYDYVSDRKAHLERRVTDAVTNTVPGRDLYIFYHTDGALDRERYSSWRNWVWDYAHMRTVSDLPNTKGYYMHFNSGWTGDSDLLSQCLNSIAFQIACGDPLSYNWVCGGWLDGEFSSPERYMGYLKCLYTAGMVGGVAGYFSHPSGGFGAELGDQIPSWLMQMMSLGRVHALFSHLEEFLRDGDLLPGPDMHRWSADLPACEFPTGDANVRVLARRHRLRDEWLITAWAAEGTNRTVTVTIPPLGPLSLYARDCASVYRVTPGPLIELIDTDGMKPSQDVRPRFAITSMACNGDVLSLEWEEVRWRYRVAWTTNLTDQNWQSVTGGVWPISTNAWIGPRPAVHPSVFYRIEAE